jgi:NodT family efflux transporter outer membrane factor (OMF) lipoprotein
MSRVVRFLLLATTISVSGCIPPRPEIPKAASVAPPADWRGSKGTGRAIDATWWQGFGDPVLAQLVEAALANNDDLAIAAARVDEARAQTALARSQLLPALDAAAAAQRSRSVNAFGKPVVQNSGGPQLQLSFDTDLFGRLKNADAAAKAALLASEGARDTVRLAVISATASSYITLRALDARLTTARETLTSRAEALRIARRRATVGYTSMLELRQAEAEYKATEQLVPIAALAVTRQEDSLSVLIGQPPAAIARGIAIDRLAAPAIPDGLPADLLRRRPDLFAAEQQIVAADRNLDSARAAFLPDIRLTGTSGVALSSLLADPITIWSIGASVLAPIFEGGRLRAQSDTAAARRDQAAFGYRKTALTAFREVEDALATTQRTSEQVDALQGQRDALAAALHLATNRYHAGYAAYLDVLDAERGLLNAELVLIQARADRLNAYVSLYQAMGGGWSAENIASATSK